jgi:hypothetical protein
LQTYAATDFIERINRGWAQGQTVYEALFRHAGRDIPLRIAEDGSLIRDQVNELYLSQLGSLPTTAIGVGQAPAWQRGVGTSVNP